MEHYVSNPTWETLHRAFHRTLLSRCPSRWLRQACDDLADQSYRYPQIAVDRSYQRRNEHAEHMAIFDAFVEGRADDAVSALTDHYGRTSAIVEGTAKARVGSIRIETEIDPA